MNQLVRFAWKNDVDDRENQKRETIRLLNDILDITIIYIDNKKMKSDTIFGPERQRGRAMN